MTYPLIRLPGSAATSSPSGCPGAHQAPPHSVPPAFQYPTLPPDLLTLLRWPYWKAHLLSKPTAQLLLASLRGREIWFLQLLWRKLRGGRQGMGVGGSGYQQRRGD